MILCDQSVPKYIIRPMGINMFSQPTWCSMGRIYVFFHYELENARYKLELYPPPRMPVTQSPPGLMSFLCRESQPKPSFKWLESWVGGRPKGRARNQLHIGSQAACSLRSEPSRHFLLKTSIRLGWFDVCE